MPDEYERCKSDFLRQIISGGITFKELNDNPTINKFYHDITLFLTLRDSEKLNADVAARANTKYLVLAEQKVRLKNICGITLGEFDTKILFFMALLLYWSLVDSNFDAGDDLYKNFHKLFALELNTIVCCFLRSQQKLTKDKVNGIISEKNEFTAKLEDLAESFLAQIHEEENKQALEKYILNICLCVSYQRRISPIELLIFFRNECEIVVGKYGAWLRGLLSDTKPGTSVGVALHYYSKYQVCTAHFWKELERKIYVQYYEQTTFSYFGNSHGATAGVVGTAGILGGLLVDWPVAVPSALIGAAGIASYRRYYRPYYTEPTPEVKLELIKSYYFKENIKNGMNEDSASSAANLIAGGTILLANLAKLNNKFLQILPKYRKQLEHMLCVTEPKIKTAKREKSGAESLPEFNIGIFIDPSVGPYEPKPVARGGKGGRQSKAEASSSLSAAHHYDKGIWYVASPLPPNTMTKIFSTGSGGGYGVLQLSREQFLRMSYLCNLSITDSGMLSDQQHIYRRVRNDRDFGGVKFEGNMCEIKVTGDMHPYFQKTSTQHRIERRQTDGTVLESKQVPVFIYAHCKKHRSTKTYT